MVMCNRFRYLGVMVGDLMHRRAAWVEVVNKLRSRLSKWKVNTLSIGGRFTLLKSVLGAAPLYHMSIFKAPKGVLKEMEAIRSKFFNDSVRQKAMMDLAVQFDNASAAKQDLRQAYEKCNNIPQETRTLIDAFLKRESDKDYEMNLAIDEIRNAVWACGENKSPGPHGFTFEFFGKFWGTIGPDLCLAVEWFFDHSTFSRGCNSSFIVLIPKVHDPKFVSDYRPISLIGSLYKLKSRLSRWKLKTLSIGGRLTLLKSVLGSTPIFWMSMYKVPKYVLSSMEAIHKNFFNGAQGNEKKITWIKWSKLLYAKKHGGLGVSSFFALNRALLFKWVWSVLKSRGVDLISHCKKRVGNGLLTRFWNDVWIGDQQLRYLFPRIYALDEDKDCSVAAKLQEAVDLSLRRHVRGGAESQQLAHLQELIGSTNLANAEDR
uniref:RNA-directed DNA polymerase, eukaryota, reverse transcriptase zinc-binding domain protein n=1 Tax=Tanacetum cinerariifolium TaxID=118510 RepID=A0A6L2K6N8_TANCI|nr:hypothetical protein [Tanacetum cinerariifolium]